MNDARKRLICATTILCSLWHIPETGATTTSTHGMVLAQKTETLLAITVKNHHEHSITVMKNHNNITATLYNYQPYASEINSITKHPILVHHAKLIKELVIFLTTIDSYESCLQIYTKDQKATIEHGIVKDKSILAAQLLGIASNKERPFLLDTFQKHAPYWVELFNNAST